jgi:hypothetical protein
LVVFRAEAGHHDAEDDQHGGGPDDLSLVSKSTGSYISKMSHFGSIAIKKGPADKTGSEEEKGLNRPNPGDV